MPLNNNILISSLFLTTGTAVLSENPWEKYGAISITLVILFWYARRSILSSEKDKTRELAEKDAMQKHHEDQTSKMLANQEVIVKELIQSHHKEMDLMYQQLEKANDRYHEIHKLLLTKLKTDG